MRDGLSEVPAMTLRILDATASIAVGLVGRLLQNHRADVHSTLEVPVQIIIHADVKVLRMLSEPLRISVLRPGAPHQDDPVGAERHFRVHRLAIGPCMSQAFTQAEGFGEPIQSGAQIFIQEVRRYARC